MSAADDALIWRVAEELARPVPPGVREVAEELMARPGASAVLFYGAGLREDAAGGGGPLDFYLLTDRDAATLVGLAGRLLPPNVVHVPAGERGAKVAVMTLAAFRARMRREGTDTTLWARFSQPARLVACRDDAAGAEVAAAVAEAVRTAAWWAACLSDRPGDAAGAWADLYAATYGAELRVEGAARRSGGIVEAAPEWFADMHRLAAFPPPADPPTDSEAARRRWRRRRPARKLLNLCRLAKAAATYRGGIAYALAKVERHSGRPVTLASWQRRWPVLAAPVVLWRLWREGRLR